MKKVWAAVLALALGGCAQFLQGQVSQFHVLDSAPKKFFVMADETQRGSLEFKTYERQLTQQLAAKGWQVVPSYRDADVAVFLHYAIGQGREVVSTYPIMGAVPNGSSYTTGTVQSFGNTATINTTTTQGSQLGVVGTGVASSVEFDRVVQVNMYSVPEYLASQRLVPVYEGTIKSTGSTGSMAAVMPTMLKALLEDFPGQSGSVRSKSVSMIK